MWIIKYYQIFTVLLEEYSELDILLNRFLHGKSGKNELLEVLI